MKPVYNYILLVDYHRPVRLRRRSTEGRYRVAAKDEKEAIKLLREKIGIGSIQVYYRCDINDPKNVAYKTVVKEEFQSIEKDGRTIMTMVHVAPQHFNAQRKEHPDEN